MWLRAWFLAVSAALAACAPYDIGACFPGDTCTADAAVEVATLLSRVGNPAVIVSSPPGPGADAFLAAVIRPFTTVAHINLSHAVEGGFIREQRQRLWAEVRQQLKEGEGTRSIVVVSHLEALNASTFHLLKDFLQPIDKTGHRAKVSELPESPDGLGAISTSAIPFLFTFTSAEHATPDCNSGAHAVKAYLRGRWSAAAGEDDSTNFDAFLGRVSLGVALPLVSDDVAAGFTQALAHCLLPPPPVSDSAAPGVLWASEYWRWAALALWILFLYRRHKGVSSSSVAAAPVRATVAPPSQPHSPSPPSSPPSPPSSPSSPPRSPSPPPRSPSPEQPRLPPPPSALVHPRVTRAHPGPVEVSLTQGRVRGVSVGRRRAKAMEEAPQTHSEPRPARRRGHK